jgi:hypothetical protein
LSNEVSQAVFAQLFKQVKFVTRREELDRLADMETGLLHESTHVLRPSCLAALHWVRCERATGTRKSKRVMLRYPIMPVTDGFGG